MFVIRHIVGRTLQVYDPDDTDMTPNGPSQVLEYDISPEAKVLLNGKEVKIANLKLGDLVIINDPSKEGWREVEVHRDRPESEAGSGDVDYSTPRVLVLEHGDTDSVTRGTQENKEYGNRGQPHVSGPVPSKTTKTEEWLHSHRAGVPESQPKLVTPNPKPQTAELPERTAETMANSETADNVSSMPSGGSEEGEATSASDLKKDTSSSKITQPHKTETKHDTKHGKK